MSPLINPRNPFQNCPNQDREDFPPAKKEMSSVRNIQIVALDQEHIKK
jgi:hypothetical protein